MKIQNLAPKKVVTGFRQVIYVFRHTIRLVWSAKPQLLISIFLVSIFSGLLVFPLIYLDKLILDILVKNIGNPWWREAIKTLLIFSLLRMVLQMIQSGLWRAQNYLSNITGYFFYAHIDYLFGQKTNQLDMITLEDPVFKDRFNKVRRESGRRSWRLVWPIASIFSYLFTIISTLSLLLLLHPLIIVAIIILSLPEFFIESKFTKAEYQYETKIAPKDRLWEWLTHYIYQARNLLETKILNLGPYFLGRLKKVTNEINTGRMEIQKNREAKRYFAYLPYNLFSLALTIFLAVKTFMGRITVGSFSMYYQAANSFSSSVSGLMNNFLELYENYLYMIDLVWFLELKPMVKNGHKHFQGQIKRGIEFKNIWFRYKKHQDWVLKGVNLFIPAGQNLALVGENGAGKTTFIKLLCRFYDPQKGQILIDGVNIQKFKRQDWWQNLGILFQDFQTFAFSAKESIGYGRIGKINNQTEIIRAAKKARIDDYINSLPLKYNNPLADDFIKGIEPSTGQWQRIALARILFRQAPLTILDEPTSNVDAKSEEEIFKEIIAQTEDKNLILISHRFSTVRRADQICVMDKGQIIEQGTHEQLMKQNGQYAELFNLQAKSYR